MYAPNYSQSNIWGTTDFLDQLYTKFIVKGFGNAYIPTNF